MFYVIVELQKGDDTMDNKLTGGFISQRRKELSLNQKQLAKKLNVTDKAVSKWETGRSAPDISMLEPLAEALEVSVVEILKGEKIEKDGIVTASDEVIVKTMKKGKHKLKLAVAALIIVLIPVFAFSILMALSYPSYDFLNSFPSNDEEKIISEVEEGFDHIYEDIENLHIVKEQRKGDYYFYLMEHDYGVIMACFHKDKLFDSRIVFDGGTGSVKPNELCLYSFGEFQHSINVFFGYSMMDDSYSYYYRGVKSTKQIEDEYVLDVLIDYDHSYSQASKIYSD